MVNRLESNAGTHRLPPRTLLAAGVGTAVGALSRRLGRGTGSVIGGRAMLAIDPDALRRLAGELQVALVSGTNGKTTTTSLLSAALSSRGPVVSNALGANLPPGITAALATASAGTTQAALEVDEAWLAKVVAATNPAVILLLNLSRDQLDRNNEVRRLAGGWRDTLAATAIQATPPHVVANADDPLVAWASMAAGSVTWVGAGQRWTADAAGCPECGGRIHFPDVLGGDWSCSRCDLHRPPLDVWLEGSGPGGSGPGGSGPGGSGPGGSGPGGSGPGGSGPGGSDIVFRDGKRLTAHLALPGRVNVANSAMAVAAARHLGVDRAEAMAAMSAMAEVAGRYRTVTVGGISARLLLAKNPAGWLETFDLLAPAPTPVVVAINARIADGKDPSWLWDVPFERLRGRLVVATGERSADLAVRLGYADVDHRRQPDPIQAIADAGRASGRASLDVVANYTSFQTITNRLAPDA